MKYLIYKRSDEMEIPIVFPEFVEHQELALKLNLKSEEIIGAGFCNCQQINVYDNQGINWYVWGKSVSLQINSKEEDAKIINSMFNLKL